MKLIRITVATLLVLCALPIIALAAAWAISAVGGCTLQLEAAHVCTIAAADVGRLLDELVRIGVWGALTLGLGAYVFAAWVLIELTAIVASTFRRG